MEHKMFSIYDQKAEAYLPPFTLPRSEMAMRTFADCINSPNHAFGNNPADYTLVELGNYDDRSGKITPYEVAIVLGTGIEFTRPVTSPQETEDGNLQPIGNDSPIQPGPSGGNSA